MPVRPRKGEAESTTLGGHLGEGRRQRVGCAKVATKIAAPTEGGDVSGEVEPEGAKREGDSGGKKAFLASILCRTV